MKQWSEKVEAAIAYDKSRRETELAAEKERAEKEKKEKEEEEKKKQAEKEKVEKELKLVSPRLCSLSFHSLLIT
jgi:hypothetical protein